MDVGRGLVVLFAGWVACAVVSETAWAQAGANAPGSTGSLFGYTGPTPSPFLSPAPGAPAPRRWIAPDPYASLGLTAEQRDKIARIQHDAWLQKQRLLGRIREQEGRLQQLYATDMPDPNKVGEVYQRIAGLRGKIVQNDIATRNEILALLSPDQRQRFAQSPSVGGPGYGGWGSSP